ncbi:hypothetical protein GALMADRAFT_148232 [Galerina marginata CBS 339.88]|uniref:Uncharacterized protein n=1 Tax=Galerina marginata (strain CBS 339.88) TaxID=685588 RepID=A0A067S593_GALM3|nr:hypothetical protein GALMADRAFT_148232 [Galerina marginata CBS 339.88]
MAEGPAKSPNSVGYIPAEYGAEHLEWGIQWDSVAEYASYIISYPSTTTTISPLPPYSSGTAPQAATFCHHVHPRAHDSQVPRRPCHITLPATSNDAGPATMTPTPPYPVTNATSQALEDEPRICHLAATYGVGERDQRNRPIHCRFEPTAGTRTATSTPAQPLHPHFEPTAATSTPTTASSTQPMPLVEDISGIASGRPSDVDPDGWYPLAAQLDQNQQADEAFLASYSPDPLPALTPAPPSPVLSQPLVVETPREQNFDVRHMSQVKLWKGLEDRLAELSHMVEDKSKELEEFQ